ncbi:MAG: CbiX/SirB N-terminal domain-containing protein [Acidobacteriota bacterium]|nr:CbiX/SirB N-terminal domain-containing protein [Acidobacteriota bacterium]
MLSSVLGVVLSVAVTAGAQVPERSGVLLLAHGGQPQWNERVIAVARAVDATQPIEVAFGMASRASIQAAVDKLTARGVTSIVAVPLFVSSHSSVITSTEYLLGLRAEAPADLKIFAKMDHSAHGAPAAATGEHAAHLPAVDPASPITTTVPVRMTTAFNRHPLIAQILADRARSISQTPASEAVILVAHGPVPDDDNQRWLDDMKVLAEQVQAAAPFSSVDYLTVRDDAGPAMREAATKDLRDRVTQQVAAGRTVLIVPHLMSFGGIEQGIRKRLEGLPYAMPAQALMPDERIAQWVLASLR